LISLDDFIAQNNCQMEFMFYIRNSKDAKAALSEADHLEFVKQCEHYIGELKSAGKLIAAQPIHREGVVLRKSDAGWTIEDSGARPETQVGYYHIRAENIDEAVAIAKNNPEFSWVPSASIEIKQVKTKESATGFVYPAGTIE
jgi:hypothetical protein